MEPGTLHDLIKQRRSVRGHKKDPKPRKLVAGVAETKMGMSSSTNIQLGGFCMLTGNTLDLIRKCNKEGMIFSARTDRGIKMKPAYKGAFRNRKASARRQ
ncbi:MAG: hypothetical protein CMQ40_07705 [Gammaproteobacteria bacterium]|nr:hypothetical protein [Gammaproteobacteria bacterium]|tara:strand:- start:361 stop:660 length:300 start_codon:yes stop_codon:yes gene_type:complete